MGPGVVITRGGLFRGPDHSWDLDRFHLKG